MELGGGLMKLYTCKLENYLEIFYQLQFLKESFAALCFFKRMNMHVFLGHLFYMDVGWL